MILFLYCSGKEKIRQITLNVVVLLDSFLYRNVRCGKNASWKKPHIGISNWIAFALLGHCAVQRLIDSSRLLTKLMWVPWLSVCVSCIGV